MDEAVLGFFGKVIYDPYLYRVFLVLDIFQTSLHRMFSQNEISVAFIRNPSILISPDL